MVAAPELGTDLQIVVVLDGSTDGSEQALADATWSVPVHAHWQPNRGLAAARNVGLQAANGGIVWFLDDDVVPSPGLLERHRVVAAERAGRLRVSFHVSTTEEEAAAVGRLLRGHVTG